jgi:hypothetical protein
LTIDLPTLSINLNMPAMPLDEDKRRDSKRDDAHIGQPTFTPYICPYRTRLTRRTTDDLTSVAPALEQELRKLEQMFTVDAAKLKEISMHFERELRQGLSRVSRCLLPSSVSPCLQSFTFNMCAC